MVNSVTEISNQCGVSREEALFYLEGFNWDLNSAMEACRNKTLPTFTDDSSPFLPICLKSDSETPSVPPRTTDSLRISNPPEKQVPSLSRDECIRIFNETILGTTREDAIEYLTLHGWDPDVAVDEFMSDRRPTHSQRKSKSHGTSSPRFDPTSAINEAEEAIARMESSQVKESDQEKDKLINRFCEMTGGATQAEAITYLKRFNWAADRAANFFLDHPSHEFSEKETHEAMQMNLQENIGNQGHLNEGNIGSSSSFDPALALKQAAEAFALSQVKESLGLGTNQDTCINTFLGLASGATREEAITYLKSANWEVLQAFNDFLNQNIQESDQENNRGNQGHLKEGNIGSSSSSSFIADPAETGSSFNETGLVNVHVAGHGIATSQVGNQNVQESRGPGRNQETSMSEASIETVIDSRRTSNQLPSWPNQLPSWPNQLPSWPNQPQLDDDVIHSFMKFVGATREDAIACLNHCNGYVKPAVNYYREGYLKEGEIRSSTRSVTADPTKTGSPFKEAAGLVDVHVAVSGIAESQVAKNWKPEAVDKDSNIETGPDPLASQEMITLQVTLSDVRNGTEESMTFRSDQTVRDIRNRIQELRPDCNKDYFLMSVEGEIYDDLNTTVQRIHSRGTTKLLQVDS
ncbi:hypothetical protein AALP_AA6G067100 [Arabis alpina]|uniref:UBA domain-containing protein n=1 Tax=Arabis alpina TaxID=50452 RepID=A0A087GMJ0_ARAAL|nr:hypothetical protein AALP_AA6G067100 [Arabis alpina]